jgi:seryl-tRNA synthetase
VHRRTPEAWADMRRRLIEAEANGALLEDANRLVRKLVRERDDAERRAARVPALEADLADAQERAEAAERQVTFLRSKLANARTTSVPAPADAGARDQAAVTETQPVDVRALMDDDPTRPLYRVQTLRDALGGAA